MLGQLEEGPRQVPLARAASWPQSGARAWLADRSGGRRLHAGVDLGRAGDVVVAPESGLIDVVVDASYGDEQPRHSSARGFAGYGPRAVVLRGDSGWWHLLAHVEHVEVRDEQRVEAGAPLARVAVRGGHLHWEVRARKLPPRQWATVEVTDDPAAWLAGVRRPYTRELGCPVVLSTDTHSPRACRPGWSGRTEPLAMPGDNIPRAIRLAQQERPPAQPWARPRNARRGRSSAQGWLLAVLALWLFKQGR